MSPPDPTQLLRIRDGMYAPDLLTVAIAELDVTLHGHRPTIADRGALIARRPA